MKWSWRIGRVAGIDVYMHATFLLLLAWVGISQYLIRHEISDVARGLLLIMGLFVIVVLHELGHALTARRYGIGTRDITLLPIGGVARLERMPDKPLEELLVALAGPAVNFVLAAIGFFLLLPTVTPDDPRMLGGGLLSNFMWVNLALGIFNLIPAFPMDGGRVLRALLAMRMEYLRATQIAAGVGQALAFGFGFIGLFSNPFLVFIALFVWMGATGEASMVQMKSALGGIPLSRVMVSDFKTLSPCDTLDSAVQHVLAGFQHDFPVVEEGRVVGVLTLAKLLTALAKQGQMALVGEVMQRTFQTAHPYDMVDGVFSRLEEGDCRSLPVVRDNQIVGLVTADNVGEFLMIQAALHGQRPALPGL